MPAIEHRLSNRSPALAVAAVSKRYGARRALDGVSLQVATGEFVVLLGPNGAGKTTLFRLLTGLFSAEVGEIRICGADLRNRPLAALASLGVVFQQPTLDLDLSVEANLRFHARLQGMGSGARDAIARELQRQGLEEERQTPCRNLSGGNRRKVELARALLHRPRLLLLDEPTVGLDPPSRRSLLEHVRQLCRERDVGVLWATHLVDEAVEANQVVVLHRGKVLRHESPAQLTRSISSQTVEEAFLRLISDDDDMEEQRSVQV